MEHTVFPQESALQRANNYVDFVTNFITEGVDEDGYPFLTSHKGKVYENSLREFREDILALEMLFEQFHGLMTTEGTGRKAKKALAREIYQTMEDCERSDFTYFVESLPLVDSLKGLYFCLSVRCVGPDFCEIKYQYKQTIELFG